MFELGNDKKYMILAALGVGVVAFFALGKKGGSEKTEVTLNSSGGVGSGTVFIPTSKYEITYDQSQGKTVTQTQNTTHETSNSNNQNSTIQPVQDVPAPSTIVDPPKATTPKPATPTPTPNINTPTTPTVVTVEKGDTLWNLVKETTGSATQQKVNEVAKANNIANPNLIYPNQKITISTATASTTKTTATTTTKTATATASTQYHTVSKGETLTAISKKYKTTVNNILKLNPNIKNANLITIGQRIRVK